MSDRQRHLVIILSILFISVLCVSSVGVATFVYRRWSNGTEVAPPVSAVVERAQGVVVVNVEPNSPAARANIPFEALIVGIDNTPVDVPEDLTGYMQTYSGSGMVQLTLRQGEELTMVPVELEAGSRRLGLEVRPINRPVPDVGEGVTAVPDNLPTLTPRPAPPVISAVMPDGAGAAAGLLPGDVVTAVDGHAILSNGELVAVITGREVGTAVQLTVRRGADTLTIPVTLGAHPDDPARGFIGIELAGN